MSCQRWTAGRPKTFVRLVTTKPGSALLGKSTSNGMTAQTTPAARMRAKSASSGGLAMKMHVRGSFFA